MLNTLPRREDINVVQTNQNRFNELKMEIIAKYLQEIRPLVTEQIIPKYKHTLALKKFFSKSSGELIFSIPLLPLDKYNLFKEDEERIIKEFYDKEQVVWDNDHYRGQCCKYSIIQEICAEIAPDISIYFKGYEIDRENNTITYTTHYQDRTTAKYPNKGFQDAVNNICDIFDEKIKNHFNFDVVIQKIKDFYQNLSNAELVMLYQEDIEDYPLVKINVNQILRDANIFQMIGIQDTNLVFDSYPYIHSSKLLREVTEKLKKLGYLIEMDSTRYEIDDITHTFNREGFEVILKLGKCACKTPKKLKDFVSYEELKGLADAHITKYNNTLEQKALEQNERLLGYADEPAYSDLLSDLVMSNTLMTKQSLAYSFYERRRYFGQKMNTSFNLPFDRTIEGLVDLGRKYYQSEGIGTKYIKMEGNIISKLREMYPVLKGAKLSGDNFYDYKHREGMYGKDNFKVEDDFLSFTFSFEDGGFGCVIDEVLEFMANSYGVLDIKPFFEQIKFTENDVANRIKQHILEHEMGQTPVQDQFKLVLGEIDTTQISKIYEKSDFYNATKHLYERKEERKTDVGGSNSSAFLAHIEQEHRSQKLANLFTCALLVNENFKRISKALEENGYKLKIEVLKTGFTTMNTGRHNIYGGPIESKVSEKHILQVVVY